MVSDGNHTIIFTISTVLPKYLILGVLVSYPCQKCIHAVRQALDTYYHINDPCENNVSIILSYFRGENRKKEERKVFEKHFCFFSIEKKN